MNGKYSDRDLHLLSREIFGKYHLPNKVKRGVDMLDSCDHSLASIKSNRPSDWLIKIRAVKRLKYFN